MDLTPILDRFGESATTAAGGLVIGLLFGIFAQRSRFCLRSAVIEFAHGSLGPKVAVWLLAFSSAVAGTQGLIAAGLLDVSEARLLATRGSLSGALIGGTLFGAGMILSRGCASRLLVLSANGNLRALLNGLVFAVTAQASLRGLLAPARDALAGLWTVADAKALNLLTLAGLGPGGGPALGLLFVAVAVWLGVRNRVPAWGWAGAVGVGATVAAGWWCTFAVASQSFGPVTVKSLAFTGASAETLMLFLSPPGNILDFDVGVVPGVFLGSFLAAALAGELKLEGFQGATSMRRSVSGAVLMGFGGMLAGGCAVGAGVTNGAIFALTAWVALTAMWAAAALTDAVLDRRGDRRDGGARSIAS